MAHKDLIVDSDAHFEIDPITRKINNLSGKTTLIQYDHNSEKFTFELPQSVEGHDMSSVTKIEIHYINISTDRKNQNPGIYEVDNMTVNRDGNIAFSWLISGNATRYVGLLAFAVRFICTNEKGELEYAWGTLSYTGVSVSDGIYNSDIIVEEYADILAQWRAELFYINSNGGGISHEAKSLLITILRNASYITDQTENIDALEIALSQSIDDVIVQSGNILSITGGVNAVQTGAELSLSSII